MSDKNFKVKNGIDANGTITILQPTTSTIPLIIKANSVATGSNMLEMQRPDGTVRFAIANDGALTVNSNINFNGGNMTMYPGNSGQTALIVNGQTNQSVPNLIVKAATNQSGNLQEWRDQSNNLAVSIGPDFALRGIAGGFFGTANGNIVGVNYLGVKGWAANHIPFVVQAVASQTGDLTRWVDSSANTLAKVDANGSISAVDLTLSGNLTVNGTTTNLNSTNLVIEDKNIIIADVATPTDTTADGAGITIKGATDKTFNWVQSTKTFTSSEPVVINNSSTDVATLVVKLASGQTSSIQEWKDHLGNVVAKVSPLYGSNIFQFDPFSYGAGAGYSSILIGGRAISNEQRAAQSKFGVTTGEWTLGALRSTDNQVGVFATSTTLPSFVVKAIASQTSAVQEWQDSNGSSVANIDKSGYFRGPLVETRPTNPGLYGVAIAANASQSGDLFQITDASNNAYTGVSATGKLVTGNTTNASRFTQLTSAALGQLTVYAPTASTIGTVIRGASSQTANLQEWQNSAGTVVSRIGFDGILRGTISDVTNVGAFITQSYSASQVPLVVRGAASQTAALQQWQDSTGAVKAFIRSDGFLRADSNLQTPTIYGTSVTGGTQANIATAWTFTTNVATNVGIIIKGAASQTANLQEWQNSGGTVLGGIASNGAAFFGSTGATNATLTVIPTATTVSGIIVRGVASQTANLQEWQNSSGTVLNSINNGGSLTLTNAGAHGIGGLSAGVMWYIVSGSSGYRPLVVQAATSQSGNLTTWQDSSGVALSAIGAYGGLGLNSVPSTTSWLIIKTGTASLVGQVIQGAASQSANLQEWQDSSGTVLANVDANGVFILRGFNSGYNFINIGGNVVNSALVNISPTSNIVPLLIRGVSGQTANLQEWQNSAGTTLSRIDAGGNIISTYVYTSLLQNTTAGKANLQTNQDTGAIGIYTSAAANKGLIIQGAASQTADLQQWQNSSGTSLSAVDSTGRFTSTVGLYTSGKISVGGASWSGGSSMLNVWSTGAASVVATIRGTASQTGDLQQWQNSSGTALAKVDSLGNFTATSKSFDIEHPTKENMRLRYGSLEGPENGVYIRGTAEFNIIELPDYWTGLVHEDSITVSLTSVGSAQNIYVEKIENNKVYIGGNLEKAFFTVYGERKDIDKLTVEY